MQMTTPLLVKPEYRDYVWGGERLRPGQRTAEMWAICEENRVTNGALAGLSLAEVAAENPAGLVGERPFERTGHRFPLLIKLLDCSDWLSVQVHPDDAIARGLEGKGHFGKTEAWHVLDADPDAQFLAGTKAGTSPQALADAIRKGQILDVANYRPLRKGDTVFMPARTIHALGPGLFVYEVQQMSDLTYRVFDWNRAASSGRTLHIDKAIAAADAGADATVRHESRLNYGEGEVVAVCPYFTLELIASQATPLQLSTDGMTFHALTVIEGAIEIAMPGAQPIIGDDSETIHIGQYESAVIPAACAPYELRPLSATKVLKASIES